MRRARSRLVLLAMWLLSGCAEISQPRRLAPSATHDASAAEGAGAAPSRDAGLDASPLAAGSPALRIHDIQGAGHTSPRVGERVDGVPGVVTAVRDHGFYLQDPESDADPRTSEALFVYTRSAPAVSPGDVVTVSGVVAEYRPGCAPCSADATAYGNLTITELRDSSADVLGHGAELPEPIALGRMRSAPARIDMDGVGSVESDAASFRPERDAIDFYESLEGMRVALEAPEVVGASREHEAVVLPRGSSATRTSRGGALQTAAGENPERATLSSELGVTLPALDVGDRFDGSVLALVDYARGGYRFAVSDPLPARIAGGLEREVAMTPAGREQLFAVATLNAENLGPSSPSAKYAELGRIIVARLGSPELIAVEEIQDDSGPRDDGTVSAARTIARLIAAIANAGGPKYDSTQIDPRDGQDGGQPGANIRQVLLFRSDRGVALVARSGATATTRNAVIASMVPSGRAELAYSPGRIEPEDPAFFASRKPLAAQFHVAGRELFVVANHFVSKSSDQPLFGRFQPPVELSRGQRVQQASRVGDFVALILRSEPRAFVLVLGDLNDTTGSAAASRLAQAGLEPLLASLPENERYTFVFDGNAQALDHIFASEALFERAEAVDVVHCNTEFATQVSDHDPIVAWFRLDQ